MKKRHAITLLEIMIVIFLIGLIGGVVGYNMKGSLDRGRAFKTQQMSDRIGEILELEKQIRGASGSEIASNAEAILIASGFFKDSQEVLKDGWGETMMVVWDDKEADGTLKPNPTFKVTSAKLEAYNAKRALH